jgi:hypothetical protein
LLPAKISVPAGIGPVTVAPQRRHNPLCHHDKLKGFLGNSTSDRAIDAAAIYELLQNLGEDTVNAGVLAVLIARVGLGTFCANAPAA